MIVVTTGMSTLFEIAIYRKHGVLEGLGTNSTFFISEQKGTL